MTLSDTAWTQLISGAHTSGRKAALAITGGGTGAVGELLRVPGGSQLLIEAQVPYSEQALENFLGFAPAQASSADTAIAMAHKARSRAAGMVAEGADLVGLGATAALVSDRPRRGEHRFHIACARAEGVIHCTAVLAKGRRDRRRKRRWLHARSFSGWPKPVASMRPRREACSARTNNSPKWILRRPIRLKRCWPVPSTG